MADGNGGNNSAYGGLDFGENGAAGGGGAVAGLGGAGFPELTLDAENGTASGYGGAGSAGRKSGGVGIIPEPGTGGVPGLASYTHGGRGGDAGDASCSAAASDCPSYGASGGGGGGAGIVVPLMDTGPNAVITGGNGGDGGNVISGATAGGDGGSGGGGGIGVAISGGAVSTEFRLFIGGNGGKGGNAFLAGGAGNAGEGGTAIVINNVALTVDARSSVTGGNGGNGGDAAVVPEGSEVGRGRPGAIGGGGINSTNSTITNFGNISGGTTGANGAYPNVQSALRAAGIQAQNTTIINFGTITGGYGNDGSVGNAIYFSGGNNRLELRPDSVITGSVNAAVGTVNTFVLGSGDADDSGVFQVGDFGSKWNGFTTFQKTGNGTWQLSGSTSQLTPWTIYDGSLLVGADAALGATGGALTFGAAGVAIGTELSGGTGRLALTGTFSLNHALILNGDATIAVASGNTVTANGAVSGAGALMIDGTGGTLVLVGSNTYTGATKVVNGNLAAGAANVIQSSSGLEIGDGATFDMNGYAQSIAQISTTGSTGILTQGAAALTLAGSPTASTATFAGVIDGSGAVVKEGNYTQVLSGDNALGYTGTTTISGGVLVLRNIVGQPANKPIILNGGWLDLSDTADTTHWTGLQITDSGIALPGGVIGYSDVVFLQPGSFSATLGSGGGPLDPGNGIYVVKDTPGETILSGSSNTYVGDTQIKQGILTVSRDDLLGNTVENREVILQGGTLRLDGSFVSTRALLLEADGIVDVTAGNSSEWAGVVEGDAGATTFGLTKTGAGVLVLSGDNHYTGDTTIAQGTLALKGVADLHGGNLVFAPGATAASFDVSQASDAMVAIGSLTDGGTGSVIALGKTELQVQGGGTFNGIIQDTALSGESGGALLKSGSNTLTLSGVNTYTGATSVTDGTLALSGTGSIASSSAVQLAAATAVLDISATTAGASVNNLSGVAHSTINLGGQTLLLNNSQETFFAGDILGTGSIAKNGLEALILSGNLAYTGTTLLNAGDLILDGADGGAQLVSNVIGTTGARLFLYYGARLTGTIDPADLSVDAASSWNMTGSSVLNTLTLAGAINITAPPLPMSVGRTLTVTNLIGQGGTITLYSVLNGNASVTDQIIIDGGTASGNTLLNIVNAGGLGGKTTGDGIKIVATSGGATTSPGAFSIANSGGKVVVGAYQYSLRRGGSSDAEDWFLVGQDRAETFLYRAYASQGMRLGQVTIGTLQDRMGALSDLATKKNNYMWGRLFGQNDVQANTTRAVGQHADIRGMQVGSDIYVQPYGPGRVSAGVYVASVQSSANVDVSGDNGAATGSAGRNVVNAYSVGAYFTRLETDGDYLDAVVQASRYNFASTSANDSATSTHGYGAVASIEIGHAFDIGDGQKIVPQLQVLLQSLKMRSFAIDDTAGVSLASTISLASRMGVRWSKTDGAQTIHAATRWVSLDFLNNRSSSPKTTISTPGLPDTVYTDQLPGRSIRLSAGADGEFKKNLRLNIGVSTEASIDASHFASYGLKLGMTLAF